MRSLLGKGIQFSFKGGNKLCRRTCKIAGENCRVHCFAVHERFISATRIDPVLKIYRRTIAKKHPIFPQACFFLSKRLLP